MDKLLFNNKLSLIVNVDIEPWLVSSKRLCQSARLFCVVLLRPLFWGWLLFCSLMENRCAVGC
jgi:hypothetical protein